MITFLSIFILSFQCFSGFSSSVAGNVYNHITLQVQGIPDELALAFGQLKDGARTSRAGGMSAEERRLIEDWQAKYSAFHANKTHLQLLESLQMPHKIFLGASSDNVIYNWALGETCIFSRLAKLSEGAEMETLSRGALTYLGVLEISPIGGLKRSSSEQRKYETKMAFQDEKKRPLFLTCKTPRKIPSGEKNPEAFKISGNREMIEILNSLTTKSGGSAIQIINTPPLAAAAQTGPQRLGSGGR